jgi:hypothetical protein
MMGIGHSVAIPRTRESRGSRIVSRSQSCSRRGSYEVIRPQLVSRRLLVGVSSHMYLDLIPRLG